MGSAKFARLALFPRAGDSRALVSFGNARLRKETPVLEITVRAAIRFKRRRGLPEAACAKIAGDRDVPRQAQRLRDR
jgi:hypothetical protein